MQRVYVYVDGESHFIRSEKCLSKLKPEMTLENWNDHLLLYTSMDLRFPPARQRILLNRSGSFFWDTHILSNIIQEEGPIRRAVYFTGCSGDESTIFELEVHLRDNRFEPFVVREVKSLRDQRLH